MREVIFFSLFFVQFLGNGQSNREEFYKVRDQILTLGDYSDPSVLEPLYRMAFSFGQQKDLHEDLAQLFVMYGARHISVTPNLDTAIVYLRKAEELSLEIELYRSLAKSRIYQAHYFNIVGDRSTSIALIQKSRKDTQLIVDKGDQLRLGAFVSLLAGDIFQSFNLYDSALINYHRAVDFAKEKSIYRIQLKALNQIGSLHHARGEDELARTFYELVIRKARQNNSNAYVASATHNIAEIHWENSRLDSALKYYKESYTIRKNETGPSRTLLTSLAKLYARIDQPDSGFFYLSKLDTVNLTQVDQHNLLSSYSLVFLADNQWNQAKRYNRKDLELSKKTGDLSWQISALKNAVAISKGSGNTAAALQYFEVLRVAEDSLFSLEKSQALLELNAKYQTDQKEQEIASLAQQNQIQKLQLREQRIVFTASVAILLLILFLGILLYRQNWIKQRQKQLSIEQNLLRTQMNPHFIFNSLASIQGLITQNQKKEAATYLAKFGALTRDILDASRKELIPLDKEIEMIRNYVLLERVRFSKSLDLEIRQTGMDESENLRVPPMMVQPFLENSIKHGFEGRDSGKISLEISKNDKVLHLSIVDDGIGLREEKEKSERSIATTIAKERLRYLKKYGKNLTVKIVNRKDEDGKVLGVHVSMDLPIVYGH